MPQRGCFGAEAIEADGRASAEMSLVPAERMALDKLLRDSYNRKYEEDLFLQLLLYEVRVA